MKNVLFLVGIVFASAVFAADGATLYKTCSTCHGEKAEKSALNKSQIIAGWSADNQFRQNNGYKDGSYIKNWNDKEDNVVAYALANIIGAKENLFDELHESLNLYYNKEVLKVTKDSVIDTLDYFNCQVTH